MATASRPTVSVFGAGEAKVAKTLPLPGVFGAPIRVDVVNFVHTQMAKNKRQAYGELSIPLSGPSRARKHAGLQAITIEVSLSNS